MPSINDSKCILVIGATAGIGRALAVSLKALPSSPKVIVTGRRQERLDELAKQGFETIKVDIDTDRANLKKFVDNTVRKYPELDSIIFSAGIQHEFDFTKPEEVNVDYIVSELNTNYTGIVTMITYFLPHLLKVASKGQPAFIIPITSGLGIVPGPWVPCYCATKAALHSYSISLNEQLRDTGVHVIEILPPLVESELHDHQGRTPALSKVWMTLDEFTKQTVEGLKRGDSIVASGMAAQGFEKFEKGKAEFAHGAYMNHKKLTASS
ncbi:NAD(P)-binding protein [Neolentinus lepideus HHB14362 ss-1]|uniref:NAD(P)-binding protein n=1 Tax=Neolentinus lepideus HHB14362 ss-1 TaxID=1314782 RepID=A0A165PYA7_9AGAM|nr:NAD(P)-binding protein [Neolentinus lepideus HHB14362 ss-1]